MGTIPFVYLGSKLFGAAGVVIGNFLGAIFVGIFAIFIYYRLIAELTAHPDDPLPRDPLTPR